jgi:zinc protease
MTLLFKRPKLASLLALPLLAIGLALPAHAAVAFKEITSPKGIKAWLMEEHSLPIISIGFAFKNAGSAQVPVGKEGLATLITALFDEGAGELDSEAFQTAQDEEGASISFGAGADSMIGSMRTLTETSAQSFNLLKLAIQQPRFDQDPIDRMRAQQIAGIVASSQSPRKKASILLNQTLFGDHPYGRQDEGTPETLNSITKQDLAAYHAATFARSNLFVAIVGDIDEATAAAKLDELFADLPAEPSVESVTDVTPKFGETLEVNYPLPQTSMSLIYPGIKRTSPDYIAAQVMNTILGGNTMTSRLGSEVREKRGLTYGISSSVISLEHTEILQIDTSTRADRKDEALSVINDVLASFIKDGPTEEELAAVKKYMIGSFAINELGSSLEIASTMLGLQMQDLPIDYLEKRSDLINAVTADDVKALAARLLGEKPTIMFLGPQAAQ